MQRAVVLYRKWLDFERTLIRVDSICLGISREPCARVNKFIPDRYQGAPVRVSKYELDETRGIDLDATFRFA